MREHAGGFSIYEAPASSNPNLHAQAGLFTALFTEQDDASPEHDYSLRSARGLDVIKLVQVTVPCAEAPKLLRLLAYEGVDGAALFPGADGVVRSMRERVLWDKPPR